MSSQARSPRADCGPPGFIVSHTDPPVWQLPHCFQFVYLFLLITMMFLKDFLKIYLGDGHTSLAGNNEDYKPLSWENTLVHMYMNVCLRFRGSMDSQLTISVTGCGLQEPRLCIFVSLTPSTDLGTKNKSLMHVNTWLNK